MTAPQNFTYRASLVIPLLICLCVGASAWLLPDTSSKSEPPIDINPPGWVPGTEPELGPCPPYGFEGGPVSFIGSGGTKGGSLSAGLETGPCPTINFDMKPYVPAPPDCSGSGLPPSYAPDKGDGGTGGGSPGTPSVGYSGSPAYNNDPPAGDLVHGTQAPPPAVDSPHVGARGVLPLLGPHRMVHSQSIVSC